METVREILERKLVVPNELEKTLERLILANKIIAVQKNTIEVCKAGMRVQDETIALLGRSVAAQSDHITHLREQVKMLRDHITM